MRFALTLVLPSIAIAWSSCSSASGQSLPSGALAERPDPLREFAGTWRLTLFSTYAMATVKSSADGAWSLRCARIHRSHGGYELVLVFMNEFHPPSARRIQLLLGRGVFA